MKTYLINSQIELGPQLKNSSLIKNEEMFFNCDFTFAYGLAGPATREFLDELVAQDQKWLDSIIDSRVTMLMKNWYPCIPGFHHDTVERTRIDGQPNYDDPKSRAVHAMALFGDDVCKTEFALGEAEFNEVPLNETVYRQWHQEVLGHIADQKLTSFVCPMNQILYFDDRAWHQGVKSNGAGWRLFVRATLGSDRKPTNEIRKNCQVYLEHPMEGW